MFLIFCVCFLEVKYVRGAAGQRRTIFWCHSFSLWERDNFHVGDDCSRFGCFFVCSNFWFDSVWFGSAQLGSLFFFVVAVAVCGDWVLLCRSSALFISFFTAQLYPACRSQSPRIYIPYAMTVIDYIPVSSTCLVIQLKEGNIPVHRTVQE